MNGEPTSDVPAVPSIKEGVRPYINSRQHELTRQYIWGVKRTNPYMASEDVKAMFLKDINAHGKPNPGWRGTSMPEDIFHACWEIAWNAEHTITT